MSQDIKTEINVLYLTINPNRMSTTAPTEGWFKHLIPKGLRPVLVSHKAGDFHNWSLQQGIPAYQISLPFPSKTNPFPFTRSLWQLYRIVKKHKIQLIHCNEQDNFPIGKYLSRICRIPIAVSVHFTMDSGFCRWAFKGARQLQRVFFVSNGLLNNCRQAIEGVIPESKVKVLYNGLDLAYFQPDQSQRDNFLKKYGLEKQLLIGTACAFRPRKQLEHLFETVLHLNVPNLKVVVAGFAVPGDEKYVKHLLENARRKMGDRLLYLGQLNSQELLGFYNALDISVNTSEEEAFSISVLEAMACGCPVIGYPSKDTVSEVVLPSGGEIVEQDNIDKLTEALAQWLNDPQKLETARIDARRQAERFDIAKIADQLWDEYKVILNK
jgi:glycosyltransferase involved in cell wall biosynthesis